MAPFFSSAQGAYEGWLEDEGFALVRDNSSKAVQIILVFLSLCIANPYHRRYLSNPVDDGHDEYTILQVNAPENDDEHTFWEFFTEENFQKMYRQWLSRQAHQA